MATQQKLLEAKIEPPEQDILKPKVGEFYAYHKCLQSWNGDGSRRYQWQVCHITAMQSTGYHDPAHWPLITMKFLTVDGEYRYAHDRWLPTPHWRRLVGEQKIMSVEQVLRGEFSQIDIERIKPLLAYQLAVDETGGCKVYCKNNLRKLVKAARRACVNVRRL